MQASAPVSQAFSMHALGPALGTEVTGLDLREPLAPEAVDTLRQAFAKTRLLLIRGQRISAQDQARFAGHFGRIEIRTGYAQLGKTAAPEHAESQHVSNVRKDGILGDGELHFHGDHYWHPEPLSALMLYAIEVPSEGGDTRFCHSGAAFAAMPAALQARLEPLRCVHMYDFNGDYKRRHDPARIGEPGVFAATHPMVRREPGTGAPALWFNPNSTAAIEGLAQDEAAELTAEMLRFIEDEAFIYRHQWRVGDLLLWDNRMLLHARSPFDASQRRTLRRSPIL